MRISRILYFKCFHLVRCTRPCRNLQCRRRPGFLAILQFRTPALRLTTQRQQSKTAEKSYSNQTRNMELIARDDVPVYLRNGTFFQNLDRDDGEKFQVPSECFKKDPSIASTSELLFILRSARFWGLDDFPLTAASYIIKNNAAFSPDLIATELPEYGAYIKNISEVGHCDPVSVIASLIRLGLGVKLIEHLHKEDGFPLSSESFLAAAELDELSVITYLEEEGCVWHLDTIMHMVQHGSIRCLMYVIEGGHAIPSGIITKAVDFQQVEILKYLLSTGIEPEPNSMSSAVLRGDLPVIRMLHQSGCAWPLDAMLVFATNDYLDCMTYAHESGFPWTAGLCTAAAARGHLRCLEYAHLHGCPWDMDTLNMAAKHDQLECLIYGHQQGFPLTSVVTRHAVNYGAWRCVRYCVLQRAVDLDLVLVVLVSLSVLVQLAIYRYYWNRTACYFTLSFGFVRFLSYFNIILTTWVEISVLCITVIVWVALVILSRF